MKVLYQCSLAVLAASVFTISDSAGAQRGRSDRDDDVRRAREAIAHRNGDWDDDHRWDKNDRSRRGNDARPGRRRGQDEEWLRRQRAQREEWCRRHRNDRRCDDVFRRGNDRRSNAGNWCWDVNRDGRCDDFDRRRDSRSGVLRGGDRGPQWERWLRANGVDVGALLPQPRVPR